MSDNGGTRIPRKVTVVIAGGGTTSSRWRVTPERKARRTGLGGFVDTARRLRHRDRWTTRPRTRSRGLPPKIEVQYGDAESTPATAITSVLIALPFVALGIGLLVVAGDFWEIVAVFGVLFGLWVLFLKAVA